MNLLTIDDDNKESTVKFENCSFTGVIISEVVGTNWQSNTVTYYYH